MKPRTDALDTPETQRRLTQPLTGAVWTILCLLVAVLVIGLLATATSRSRGFWG